MIKTSSRLGAVLLCGAAFLAGCQDLTVPNYNDPDHLQALNDPENVQNLVAGSWRPNYWYRFFETSSAYLPLMFAGGEAVSYYDSYIQYNQKPFSHFDNDYSLSNRHLSQSPWGEWHEGIANTGEALDLILNKGMRIMVQDPGVDATKVDHSERAVAFAWFLHGLFYANMAMTFDQAMLAGPEEYGDPTRLESLDYSPYPEIARFAVRSLEEAIRVASTSEPFNVPAAWMSYAVDNEGLVRLAHSYIARLRTFTPRTPAERQAVDWDQVIYHVDRGITTDFAPMTTREDMAANYLRYLQMDSRIMTNYMAIGPADVSGNYREWLNTPLEERDKFLITTPDRRITGVDDDGNPAPTVPGKYFRYRPTGGVNPAPGHYRSYYAYYRWAGKYYDMPVLELTLDEMRLIKAEALLRTGRAAEAADLINVTRQANGELPPVTAVGVPESANCVPRTFDGENCGTLLDALHHERVLEGMGQGTFHSWWDRRGFGTLEKGVYLQLPIPDRELQNLQIPWYSFGGSLPFSADGILQVR
jgi:hypothetical protein